jgi:hypothetical protein
MLEDDEEQSGYYYGGRLYGRGKPTGKRALAAAAAALGRSIEGEDFFDIVADLCLEIERLRGELEKGTKN